MANVGKSSFVCLWIAISMIYGSENSLNAQTCCSGGVPLSGNMGFAGAGKGTLQIEISYDLNYLSRLLMGSELVEEESRVRMTQSLLLKAGYSLTDYLAVDALFSYVHQRRSIQFLENVNMAETHGVGDALLMAKLVLSRLKEQSFELQLGAGPKIPLGRSNMADDRGIAYNADMQPGSGSWDLFTWIYGAWQPGFRPAGLVSGRIAAKLNGTNNQYLGSGTYQFGHTLQVYLGYGDQILLGDVMLSPSFQLHYRHARNDRIMDVDLPNTGGQWLYAVPGISWHIRPGLMLHLLPEIPVYSSVNGIQLSPTFRIQAGFYIQFGGMKEMNNQNIYQL
jgi:hypothetical protein